ncbi:hypothetical protein [Aliiroseovarius lamellibrachiae]|uniref:hypothetical protein n=1 Tax=Aliiroseovarius lamellibrachiae TaxID=1924933 RepID=UPI001BE0E55D|nr:hypothetical protein [Aliiroseovarius lamellibrachiae]MBT2130414.1 hypothetical protein [Aliiroseovarius lamellibrachiae]
MEALRQFGAEPKPAERIVRSGKIWTAAGVSAGIDLAFALVEELTDRATAERIQLLVEYDPHPPQDSGHMSKASKEVADAAWAEMAQHSQKLANATTPA